MVSPKLPWDLESEILSRVPPAHVTRLQLTCKRWCALFKDPRFIKNHLGKAATQMVLLKEEWLYSFSFDFHRITKRYDQSITFTGKLMSLKDSKDVEISKIFHCEGLLLCTTKDNRLVVWNPCTGQTRWIQSRLPSNNSYTMYDNCFLGYGNKNKSCDGFKILGFTDYDHQDESVDKFEMYEFKSDSWRVLHEDTGNWGILTSHGVSLNGNTYWLNSDDEEDQDIINFILRFDFTKERFERLSLPFHSDENDVGVLLSVVREEKLALLFQSFASTSPLEMKIWVTNTKVDEAKDLSWSMFLVLNFNKVTEGMIRVLSFLVNEESKRVMCCYEFDEDEERTIVYVAGEDLYKIVYRETTEKRRRQPPSPLLFSYIPSLVQIQAVMAKEKDD